ncbi:MAG: hypothetical protein U0904_08745 [Candidatus Nanopelagicales bacterium]|nr:hypothetical protein [Candidatus Nanopelagicales bacterium]
MASSVGTYVEASSYAISGVRNEACSAWLVMTSRTRRQNGADQDVVVED